MIGIEMETEVSEDLMNWWPNKYFQMRRNDNFTLACLNCNIYLVGFC